MPKTYEKGFKDGYDAGFTAGYDRAVQTAAVPAPLIEYFDKLARSCGRPEPTPDPDPDKKFFEAQDRTPNKKQSLLVRIAKYIITPKPKPKPKKAKR